MKTTKIILTALIMISALQITIAQSKYLDKNGTIVFEASEEAFEPVKATNESVTVILNTETGDIASLGLIKSFRFKNSLMEEHFNENYIESETYPKATFKGSIKDFDASVLSDKATDFMVEGTLSLHGTEKQISTSLTFTKDGDVIGVTGGFNVTPEDFNIEIPSVVKNKIAKEINVTLDFKLAKK